MNSSDAIGGYFGLELSQNKGISPIPKSAIPLNTARNAFEYVLKTHRFSKVFLPKYICDAMLEPLLKEKIDYQYYAIGSNLEIENKPQINGHELLVYVNYFGLKDAYAHKLASEYGNKCLIDASQSFYYAPASNEHVIYSARKFFGVADGGYLITDKKLNKELEIDSSVARMTHLVKRVERGAEEGYLDFQKAEESLENMPIKRMSPLTAKMIDGIDFEFVRQRRLANFSAIHEKLKGTNELHIDLHSQSVPLIYPYYTMDGERFRKKLAGSRIYSATYWPNVLESCSEEELEYSLAKNVVALPIDQRYDYNSMERIIEVLNT